MLLTAFSFSSLNVYRGVLEAVLELMLCSQRSLRLILNFNSRFACFMIYFGNACEVWCVEAFGEARGD